MKLCKHQLYPQTCGWCRQEKKSAGKWKVNVRPRTGLQIKYLRMIMPAKDLEILIDRYVAAKKDHLFLRQKSCRISPIRKLRLYKWKVKPNISPQLRWE